MTDGTAIYNLRDLSIKLKLSIRTLREYIKRGKLKGRLIGRQYLVTENDLLALLDQSK